MLNEKLKAFTIFLSIILTIVFIVEINKIEVVPVYAQKIELNGPKNDLGRFPVQTYYEEEFDMKKDREETFNKIVEEMKVNKTKNGSIKPVLEGKLKGYEGYILNTCHGGDIVKAKISIALIFWESTRGTSQIANERNNFHGIKPIGGGDFVTFNSIEEGLCKAKNYIGYYIREFAKDPSPQNMNKVFAPYCLDADGIKCIHTAKGSEKSKLYKTFEEL